MIFGILHMQTRTHTVVKKGMKIGGLSLKFPESFQHLTFVAYLLIDYFRHIYSKQSHKAHEEAKWRARFPLLCLMLNKRRNALLQL